jgi:hypothetical protein
MGKGFEDPWDTERVKTIEMKFTQYFLHIRRRPDRAKIKMKWIEETVRNADYTEIQEDGRIRKWKNIKEEQKKSPGDFIARWRNDS